jgi:hypothetical protein
MIGASSLTSYSAMGSAGWSRRALPVVLLVASPVAAFYAHEALAPRSHADVLSICGTLASIAGTLLGFVIAALSILTAVMDRKLVVNLRLTGHFERMLKGLYLAAVLFMVVLSAALVSLFLPEVYARIGGAISAVAQANGLVALAASGRQFYLTVVHLK